MWRDVTSTSISHSDTLLSYQKKKKIVVNDASRSRAWWKYDADAYIRKLSKLYYWFVPAVCLKSCISVCLFWVFMLTCFEALLKQVPKRFITYFLVLKVRVPTHFSSYLAFLAIDENLGVQCNTYPRISTKAKRAGLTVFATYILPSCLGEFALYISSWVHFLKSTLVGIVCRRPSSWPSSRIQLLYNAFRFRST